MKSTDTRRPIMRDSIMRATSPSAMPKVFAIVPAAGQGTRIGDAVPKQYLPLAGKPMMFHAIEVLAAVSRIACVSVVLSPLDRHWGEHDWSGFPDKIEPVFAGGAHRAETVRNALDHLDPRLQPMDWILVHDAARPCIAKELVEQFLDEIGDDPVGGLLAMPLADTLKSSDENQRVATTIPRLNLWRAQTPQMFRYEILRKGLEQKPDATDEAQAVESVGYNAPRLVQGDNLNIKVTFAADLVLAELIMELRKRSRAPA
jgi:2-C-methyl-D-erythritol 4-phosphate cytidylyltransferase